MGGGVKGEKEEEGENFSSTIFTCCVYLSFSHAFMFHDDDVDLFM